MAAAKIKEKYQPSSQESKQDPTDARTLVRSLPRSSQGDTSVKRRESFLPDNRVECMRGVPVSRHLERIGERVLLCLKTDLDDFHRVHDYHGSEKHILREQTSWEKSQLPNLLCCTSSKTSCRKTIQHQKGPLESTPRS